jgi:hypothetical protein
VHDIVSPDVMARFESHAEDPDHREAVLVTSDRPLERQTLIDAGLDVSFVSGEGTIAAGTVDRAALERLTQLSGVARVEAEGEMHALDV